MPINIPEPPRNPGQPPLPQAGPDRSHGEPAGPGSAVRSVPEGRWYGVYPALVRENRDPDGLGRVRVLLPWAADADGTVGGRKQLRYEAWARLATMMAGSNRGSWFLPELDDEVLVAFEAGDPSRPVVVGALWNGQDVPPVTANAGNSIKVLRTRSGSEIRFDDQAGSEAIEISTGAGPSIRLTVADGGAVRVTDGGGNAVTLGRHPARDRTPVFRPRADRLGELRQRGRARSRRLGDDQQVRRRLPGQAVLRRLRVRGRGRIAGHRSREGALRRRARQRAAALGAQANMACTSRCSSRATRCSA
jgi:hypothetical protein